MPPPRPDSLRTATATAAALLCLAGCAPTLPPPSAASPTAAPSTATVSPPKRPPALNHEQTDLTTSYDGLLDRVRGALDAEFGPLTWTTPQDARLWSEQPGYSCRLLTKTVWAQQLPAKSDSYARARRVIDDVIIKEGFPPTSNFPGGVPDQLNLEAIRADGTAFEVSGNQNFGFWVDTPQPVAACG